uniref:tRNA wybutosine-synthesizing protein 3 homolog n=1 Tax=Xenopus laevis TaxID=8355 RepID=TYW3_XENLA|nr:RecName: Full=tRNA wybutosine-synthesizing protein 3 homolog; Short=tRNA-yW-synthesizing protein 3; AltName: Full=tRNA(Phe) 7-((3-amino-3-carboxypropyl)-4-demethylwyosine(37)-N(4))-methyltransferase [Xenopus laevis]AAH82379.1 MGC81728 protein [Xenopus laevis]
MEKQEAFSHWKQQSARKTDVSKKGSVDEDIEETVRLINQQERYFTTSSCSGRVIIINETLDNSTIQKQNCSWLFVTHKLCKPDDVFAALQNATGDVVLKFEPFVLHVQCRALEDAQLLHSVAINAGFRNSGITVGKKGKIIMAVRSTHGLEVPLTQNGKCLVSHEYIEFLVHTANKKMEENKRRITRFHSCLHKALQKEDCVHDKTSKEQASSCVYVRRRKRKDRSRKSNCSSSEEEHTDSEPELTLFNDP